MASKRETRFKARLEASGEGSAWVLLRLPFSVEETFGAKGRVSVKGSLNDVPFRTSVFPSGDGTHHMMVNKEMQQRAQVGAGSSVEVTMAVDTSPGDVELPPELEHALRKDSTARTFFEGLPPSAKKAYAVWISSAKKEETRSARLTEAIQRLRERKRLE